MRISRRTSGGRGEYEVSGSVPGVDSADLVGRVFFLDIGTLVPVSTGVELREQGGKRRLRLVAGGIQLHRQLAAALMMPEPVRADEAMGAAAPVLQSFRFAIETIDVTEVALIPPMSAVLTVNFIIVRNRTYSAEQVDVGSRAADIRQIWNRKAEFPSDISELIARHERAVKGGNPITIDVERLVGELQARVSDRSADLSISFSSRGDVLEALRNSLQLEVMEPLVTIADLDPEDVDLKRRTIGEWRRWVNARGPSTARFRQRVREAYRATCIACGLNYPATFYNPVAGVDSAHILPWCDYDLDEVFNGLCLCRQHHWAFDQGLLTIAHDNGQYVALIPDDTAANLLRADPQFSVAELMRNTGPIPPSRLPRDRRHWPRPDLLASLASVVD